MKACPAGWHLPTYEEWMKMINAIGGVANASMKLRPGGGTGFNVLMAGYKLDKGMEFEGKNTDAIFWTASPFQGNTYWAIQFKSYSPKALEAAFDKNTGASCRCIKDAPGTTPTTTTTAPAATPTAKPTPAK